MIKIEDDLIRQTCQQSSSMAEAARALNINYKTLRQHATRLDCFKDNRSGKGISKPNDTLTPLQDIFNGAQYSSHKLKLRLIKEGYKQHQCEQCMLTEWRGLPIPIELHHIDGEHNNNELSNLQLLCPNCHAQTDNYCKKKG